MTLSKDIFEQTKHDPQVALQKVFSAEDALPYFRAVDGSTGPTVTMDGREMIMLGSNNYLGLTRDPRVLEAAKKAIDCYGTGSTGSRFLNGTTSLHEQLENEIAAWFGAEAAMVTTTGYQANLSVMSSIASGDDSIICDSANHASILDGISLSTARLRSFRHGRMDRLEAALKRASRDGGGALVIVDGIFSMEGDVADLGAIVHLCDKYGARVAVDEAHAVGVLGEGGTGSAELYGVESEVDLRTGTFSKSLAACGGFVVGSKDVIEYLKIKSRPFLFTTANVPAAVGAALEAVRICRSEEGRERFSALAENARYLRAGLIDLGLNVGEPSDGPDGPIITPIVPVYPGEGFYAVALWKALWKQGVYASLAIYPAVPQGQALLRLSLMASHTREDLDRAFDSFERAMPLAREEIEPMQDLVAHASSLL